MNGARATTSPVRPVVFILSPLELSPFTELLYSNRMAVHRQESASEPSGRLNQKRRTRSAIIAAAQAIFDRGDTPTVAKAAEAALVSRTTAYSYFPTQESLLFELSINFELAELEELALEPLNGTKPADRLLAIVDLLNRHMLANEKLCRTAIRHYNDAWLAAERTGEPNPSLAREGRRRRWIATSLEALRNTIPDDNLRRLEAA